MSEPRKDPATVPQSREAKPHIRVTSREIAEAAGVSQATVSRALRQDQRVAPETRRLIRDIASELGYVASRTAQGLTAMRSMAIGLVVADLANEFYVHLLRPMLDELTLAGYRAVLFVDRIEFASDPRRLEFLLDGSVDGVILTTIGVDSAVPGYLSERGLPCALAVRRARDARVDSIVSDNLTGGEIVIRHLVDLGHEKIAAILGPSNVSTTHEREQGMARVLRSVGLSLRPEDRLTGSYSHEHGYAAMSALLARKRDRPSAVACGNDVIAIGALDAARASGAAVPDEISVIGFDDIPMAGWHAMRLTTVRQPIHHIGQTAVRRLIERIESNEDLPPRMDTFPVSLVKRETTAPPAG